MIDLMDQIEYDRWANLRLIDVIADLDEDGPTRDIVSSFPSLQKTLVHLLWAEELWLERWQGRSFVRELDPTDFPTPTVVRDHLENVHGRQRQVLANLAAGGPDQMIGYENFLNKCCKYTLARMVRHLTMHSAYHRGQMATLLRQLGVVPPCTDYLVYVDDTAM